LSKIGAETPTRAQVPHQKGFEIGLKTAHVVSKGFTKEEIIRDKREGNKKEKEE